MYNLTAVLAALYLSHGLADTANAFEGERSSVPRLFETGPTISEVKWKDQDCHVDPYNAFVDVPSFPLFDETRANVYRYRQQQAVNLGSWFVHEKWMTPSLFRCASGAKLAEIDIAGGWGGIEGARAVLEKHWDIFITPADFDYLASVGINTVRLPIGYWVLGSRFVVGTPFEKFADVYKNAWPRILRAISQADKAGIGVLVDLHGAVGSQNGQHHSGVSDGQVSMFKSWEYQQKTIEVLKFLAEELAHITNVIGIQLLNEPVADPSLENFYTSALDAMRKVSLYGKDLPLYIHDAFDLGRWERFVANRPDFVVQDHHAYFVFTEYDNKRPAHQHTKDINGPIAESLRQTAKAVRSNLVVGEWSCALSSESLTLSRYRDKLDPQGEFCKSQAQVYAKATSGWHFWSYTKELCENDLGWCFKHAVGSVLPSTFFSYDSIKNNFRVKEITKKIRYLDDPANDAIVAILNEGQGSRRRPKWNTHDFGRNKRGQYRFQQARNGNGSDSGSSGSDMKGFKDGYQTAKVFAIYDMSKLGFSIQFVNDILSRAGPGYVPSGTEEEYKNGFMHGVGYGEQQVLAVVGSSN